MKAMVRLPSLAPVRPQMSEADEAVVPEADLHAIGMLLVEARRLANEAGEEEVAEHISELLWVIDDRRGLC